MMGNYQVRFLGEGNTATRVLLPDWGGWGETPVPTRRRVLWYGAKIDRRIW